MTSTSMKMITSTITRTGRLIMRRVAAVCEYEHDDEYEYEDDYEHDYENEYDINGRCCESRACSFLPSYSYS
jgi:hypothetical protein